MDVYTRHLLVQPRQEDLLREARDARLAREVQLACRVTPQRAFMGRVEGFIVGPLSALRADRNGPPAEPTRDRRTPVLRRAGVRG